MSENKGLFKNIVSLGIVQVSNYLLPIVTVPYVSRIIGVEKFGAINLSSTIIAYFSLLINFSFDLTSARAISINRNNPTELKLIISKTYYTKIFLFLISTILFYFILKLYIPQKYTQLYMMSYLVVIGNLLFPYWYFMGIEKLALASVLTFATKLITTILVFFLIKKPEDYFWQNFSYSISNFIFGFLGFYYLYKSGNINFNIIPIKTIWNELKSGFSIFSSFIIYNLYTASGVTLLGVFSSEKNVGIFAASSKIVNIIFSIIILPLGQSLFPVISRNLHSKKEETLEIISKNIPIIILFFIIAGFFNVIFSKLIIIWLYGDAFIDAVLPMIIMSFIPLFLSINQILNIQIMINLGLDKIRLKIYLFGALISISINILLISKFQYIGTSISWLITEMLILYLGIYNLNKINLNPFKLSYFTFRSIYNQIKYLIKAFQ